MEKHRWTIEETQELFIRAEEARKNARPVADVFRETGAKLGISASSVRNFYYTNIKTFSMLNERAPIGIELPESSRAFTQFSDGEAEEMLLFVLKARLCGKSVHAAVREFAGGDPKLALRYQNKYRAMIFRQRARVERLMAEWDNRGETFFHPYENRAVTKNLPLRDNESAASEMLERVLGAERAELLIAAIARVLTEKSPSSALPALRGYVDRLHGDRKRPDSDLGQGR